MRSLYKSCKKKKRFANFNLADKALKAAMRNYPDSYSGQLHTYDCYFCNGWHIGHVPGQRRLQA